MSEQIQYMVRDPQGSVYGPAPMELIGQWVREGRITAAMQLAPEGSVDWKPAAAYPELRELISPGRRGGGGDGGECICASADAGGE